MGDFDSIKGSDYDQDAVEILCKDAPKRVIEMENWGTLFSRTKEGKIAQRPADFPRTAYAEDRTGHSLLHTMYELLRTTSSSIMSGWLLALW